ncbi:17585_t:CDS:2, partial [Entrophospora sp. SA101]
LTLLFQNSYDNALNNKKKEIHKVVTEEDTLINIKRQYKFDENNNNSKKLRSENQEGGEFEYSHSDDEQSVIVMDPVLFEELQNLTNDEISIRNLLLEILYFYKTEDSSSRKTFMDSIFLNGIIDMMIIEEQLQLKLNQEQINLIKKILNKEIWSKTSEFEKYCNQFKEEECNRVMVPSLVRKSFVEGRFDSFLHEGHDIAQDLMKHFSVRLEAPVNIDSKALDFERTYSVDTIIYIFNRVFRMHQDVLEWRWIELTTPNTKAHKFDGKASTTKETDDNLKLVRNAKRVVNKLLEKIPSDLLRVYTVQCINGYIHINYMIRPFPCVYLYEKFGKIKIPITFNDMEQFSEDITTLMNFQIDVLKTIRNINKYSKSITKVYKSQLEDTPITKSQRAELLINKK